MNTPLVLIPGLLCDEYMWSPQAEALSAARDVFILDLSEHESIPAMARAALHEAPARFALAGHSFGGRIAMEICAQAPGRITHLALLDTAAHPTAPHEYEARRALVTLAREHGMRALVEPWLMPMLHESRRREDALVRPLIAMLERSTPERFSRQQEALLARPDARPGLATIACPTLVACGREDAWSPVAQHEDMAAVIPGATLAVIEVCGHMSTVERPAEITALLHKLLLR
ncbi:MAG: alpha/beta fold hydrolase [Hyphomonadaceae bacterium]|nr:alpha/beta fold hydrolase [Hyphomonadaceae bacterium]